MTAIEFYHFAITVFGLALILARLGSIESKLNKLLQKKDQTNE